MTIADGVATFSEAQTATNMGVGDKITYGTVGVVYISGKQSTSIWNVVTATGTTPVATTSAPVNSIAHPFSSLRNAVGAYVAGNATSTNFMNTSDLVTGDFILNIPVYYDTGADTTAVTLIGYTTGENNYIRIYTPTSTDTQANLSQRHSGVWNNSKYRLVVGGRAMDILIGYVRIEGLQFTGTGSQGIYANVGTLSLVVSDSLFTGSSHGLYTRNTKIYNSVIYGNNIGIYNSTGVTYAYNVTFANNSTYGMQVTGGSITAKNCLFYNHTTDASGGTPTYCATSNDDTKGLAAGTGNRYSQTFTFVDANGNNFHLDPSDGGGRDFGTNLSADSNLSFSFDVDGHARPQGSAWDIGADEVYVDTVAPTITSVASSTTATGAVITWSTDENATSTVRYGLTDSYGLASSSLSFTSSHSITLSGLSPSTLYHFQVSSGDSSNNHSSSADYTFTTTDPDLTAPVISSISTSTTGTTATITWTTDESATSSISYGLTTSYGSASSSVATLVTSHSITLTSLSTSTTYHLRLTSTDASYNSVSSSDIVITTTAVSGTSYYVDFDGGSNSNSGRSSLLPWKHSPGDPNATGVPASTVLVAGDAVFFKGGVRYKGGITIGYSGTEAEPIIFNGNSGWGTGKAIIDGTVTTSWTQCPDAATCGGNSNYQNIYYATLPVGADWHIPVFDTDSWLYHQIDVSLTDPFIYSTTDDWHATSSGITTTSASDSSVFTNSDSGYYAGSYIQTQLTGNVYGVSRITSFDPSTDTVTYNVLDPAPVIDNQWDNKYHYSIVNNYRAIDSSGYYAVDEDNSKIYAWPRTSTSNLSIGSLEYGFDTNGKSYVTIDGFKIQGQYNRTYDTGIAVRGSNSTATNGIIIQNNDIKNQVSDAGASANVYLLGAGTSIQYYRNNTMAYAYGRGILAQGAKNYVQDNTFDRSTGTVIFYFSASGAPAIDGTISGNTITNSGGLHANGITVYGIALNIAHSIIIKNNLVYDFGTHAGPFAVSQQSSYDITFYNNLFEGQVIDDGPSTGCTYMRYYNNIMIDGLSLNKGFRIISPQNCSEFTVRGNIIDGFLGASNEWDSVDHTYNLYLSRAWNQSTGYGWTDGVGEADTTLAAVFNNSVLNDFSLKSGGPAVNAFPTAQAPSMIYSTDILSVSRPQGSAWDIGPYELTSSPTLTTSAPTSVSTSTLTLNATITDTGTDNATQSGFAYGTVSNLLTVISTTTLGSQSGTASFSSSISSLLPNTLYYFRAYATNSAGTGYGSILSTTTLATSSPTITTQAVSSITSTTATGNGTIAATGYINPTARGVSYGLTTAYGATTTSTGDFSAEAFTSLITGLTCGTTYHVRAYATNSEGTGYGSDVTFTTSACPVAASATETSTSQTTSSGSSATTRMANLREIYAQNNIPCPESVCGSGVGSTVASTPLTTSGDTQNQSSNNTNLPGALPRVADDTVTDANGSPITPSSISSTVEALRDLPSEIITLVNKFPEIGRTITEIAKTSKSDVSDVIARMKKASFAIPGISKLTDNSTGIPISSLTVNQKKSLPTDVVFAKSGDFIDYSISLSVASNGQAEQILHTVSGKSIDLALKPEKPVKSITGYITIKNIPRTQGMRPVKAKSMVAASIVSLLAEESSKPEVVDNTMVLSKFSYTDSDKDGIYTAHVDAPKIHGEYDIMTIMEYKDNKLGAKEFHLTTVIDPEGYVYEKINSKKEARVNSAKVSILAKNPKTGSFELWQASKYKQINPQLTDITGMYSFLVPEGKYKLTVTAPGYYDYNGKEFEVIEGQGIHENIEMKQKGWWRMLLEKLGLR